MGDFTSDPIEDLRKEKNRRIAELEAQLRAANERAESLNSLAQELLAHRFCPVCIGEFEFKDHDDGGIWETCQHCKTLFAYGERNARIVALSGVIQERDQARADLTAERAAHEETRRQLIIAKDKASVSVEMS